MDPLTQINTRTTPQTQQADPRQVPNAAGGYAFRLDHAHRVHRFLTLGTTGGTYYTSERDLTVANTDVIKAAARSDGLWLVEQAVAVSVAGRAPKQNPAIFALAVAAGLGNDETRAAALAAVPLVCRTGTTLFTFAQYVQQFRGWGRGLRRAIGDWYLRDLNTVTYQLLKYRQRNGWSHRDLLRLSHPDVPLTDTDRRGLFAWAVGKGDGQLVPELVNAFEQAQTATGVKLWSLIERYPLSWEMLPDSVLTSLDTWAALLDADRIPATALMRQLPRLTRYGVFDSDRLRDLVCDRLTDVERLRRGRIHPVNVLVAMKTYAQGYSEKGRHTWQPNRHVVDALDAAFYAAFGSVVSTGKRTLLALDVSGSMGVNAGGLPVTCYQVSAALALVTMATEEQVDVIGYTSGTRQYGDHRWARPGSGVTPLTISPRQRLDDVVRYMAGLPFCGTDCSLPFRWALEEGRVYDTVVSYTDNETWAGPQHVHQALRAYRDKHGIATRSIVVGMTANDVSIADPSDRLSLDIAGFDSAVPNLISDFSRGDL